MSLTCSKCLTQISVDPASGHAPAWCPHCGADRKAFEIQATSVLGVLREACPQVPASGPYHADNAAIPAEDLAALAPAPRRFPQSMGIIIPIIIAACLFGFVSLTSLAITKLTTYHRVEGRVVDFVKRKTTKYTWIHPVVSFNVGAANYRFKNSESMGWFAPTYKLGDTVEVLYPPGEPDQASINSYADLWFGPLVCGIPGFGLLAVLLCVRYGIGVPKYRQQVDYALVR